jgi:hypothetical protein
MTLLPNLPRPLRARLSRTLLAVFALASTATAAAQPATAPVDADWILARLVRPAPMQTPFVEVRESPMLTTPLRIEGVYRRPQADTLVREVRAPYAETTTIRAGEVTIARDGRRPRRFSLSRVPELAGLQASFGALLAGDAAALRRGYRIAADGSRQDWRMTLVPLDPGAAAGVRDIVLHGRGAELRCIETTPVDGAVQRTLLATAARAASAVATADALATLCRDPGAASP